MLGNEPLCYFGILSLNPSFNIRFSQFQYFFILLVLYERLHMLYEPKIRVAGAFRKMLHILYERRYRFFMRQIELRLDNTAVMTLIFQSGRGWAQEGKSCSICLLKLISCLSCANVHAFHGNPDLYIYLTLERQCNNDRLLLSFEVTLTNNVDQDQAAPVGAA